MKRIEIVPEKNVIDEVLEKVLLVVVKKIEKEVGCQLPTKVSIICDLKVEQQFCINGNEDTKGEIHLHFSEAFGGGRILYFAESIYDHVADNTGFSGFQTTGEINSETLMLKRKGFIMQYNVWDWKGWR